MNIGPGSDFNFANQLESFVTGVELSPAAQQYLDQLEIDLRGTPISSGFFSGFANYSGLAQQTLDLFDPSTYSMKTAARAAGSAIFGFPGTLAMGAFFPNDPYPELFAGQGPIANTGNVLMDAVTAKTMDIHFENYQRNPNDVGFVNGELVSISRSKLPGTDIELRSITGNVNMTVEDWDRATAVRDGKHPETGDATLAPAGGGFIDTATGNYVSRSGQITSYGPAGTMEELARTNPEAHALAMENRSVSSFSRMFDALFGPEPTPRDLLVEDPLAVGPESRPSQGTGPTYETRSVPATDAKGRGIMSGRPGVQVMSGMVETVRKDPESEPEPELSVPDDIEGAMELDFGYEASDMAADDPATDEAEV